MDDRKERVQKILAQRGVGSRRQIEAWISQGVVLINNKPAVLGSKAAPTDHIQIHGRVIPPVLQTQRLLLYNKPIGEICTRSDPQGRPTVFSNLPKLNGQRWVAVGRLDINSGGLIIFTTDGELANELMHPKAKIEREYAVRVLGTVTDKILQRVVKGVTLDDGTRAKFNTIKFAGGEGANSWYSVTLQQGRYREVRRIWEAVGLRVSRLLRIRYGDFSLPRDLAPGNYVEVEYGKTHPASKKKKAE